MVVRNPLLDAPLWLRVVLALLVIAVVQHLASSHDGLSLATLVLVNAGEVRVLNCFFNKVTPESKKLKLYKSNTTPAETDTLATYTESTFTGYAAITLAAAAWTVTSGAPSDASAAAQTFTSSADQTAENAYGYTVEEATAATLNWAERFTGAPYVIQNNNDAIQITPKFTAD